MLDRISTKANLLKQKVIIESASADCPLFGGCIEIVDHLFVLRGDAPYSGLVKDLSLTTQALTHMNPRYPNPSWIGKANSDGLKRRDVRPR